jgi:hypothetical protein
MFRPGARRKTYGTRSSSACSLELRAAGCGCSVPRLQPELFLNGSCDRSRTRKIHPLERAPKIFVSQTSLAAEAVPIPPGDNPEYTRPLQGKPPSEAPRSPLSRAFSRSAIPRFAMVRIQLTPSFRCAMACSPQSSQSSGRSTPARSPFRQINH